MRCCLLQCRRTAAGSAPGGLASGPPTRSGSLRCFRQRSRRPGAHPSRCREGVRRVPRRGPAHTCRPRPEDHFPGAWDAHPSDRRDASYKFVTLTRSRAVATKCQIMGSLPHEICWTRAHDLSPRASQSMCTWVALHGADFRDSVYQEILIPPVPE
jgi:hypothetical protein